MQISSIVDGSALHDFQQSGWLEQQPGINVPAPQSAWKGRPREQSTANQVASPFDQRIRVMRVSNLEEVAHTRD